MQQSQWPKAQSRVTKQLHTNSQTRLQKKLCRGPEMEGNRLPSHADHYWPSRVPGHQSKSKVTDCSLYLGTESTSEKTCTSNLRRPQRSEREESHCPEPTRLVWSHYFAVPTGMAWHGINALKSSQQRTTRRKAVALSKHLPGLTSERTTTLKFLWYFGLTNKIKWYKMYVFFAVFVYSVYTVYTAMYCLMKHKLAHRSAASSSISVACPCTGLSSPPQSKCAYQHIWLLCIKNVQLGPVLERRNREFGVAKRLPGLGGTAENTSRQAAGTARDL